MISVSASLYSNADLFLWFNGFRHWDLTEHGMRMRNQVRQ